MFSFTSSVCSRVTVRMMERFLKYVAIGYFTYWASQVICVLAICVLYVVILLKLLKLFFVTSAWPLLPSVSETIHEIPPSETNYEIPAQWAAVAKWESQWRERFERVLCCDSDTSIDPMYPNASVAYLVRTNRDVSSFRRIIGLWRVSTLTGERREIAKFEYLDEAPYAHADIDQLDAFESRGVVFIVFRHVKMIGTFTYTLHFLFVYGTLSDKKAILKLKPPLSEVKRPISIQCLGRRTNPERVLTAWRIRLCHVKNHVAAFMNSIVEVSACDGDLWDVEQEGVWIFPTDTWTVPIRTTGGELGVYQIPCRRVYMFDTKANQYSYHPDVKDFMVSRPPLRTLFDRSRDLMWLDQPMVFTDHEALQLNFRGTAVMRTTFKPPKLRMLAARALFEANPNLAYEMTAQQFRRETGVDLIGQFQ